MGSAFEDKFSAANGPASKIMETFGRSASYIPPNAVNSEITGIKVRILNRQVAKQRVEGGEKDVKTCDMKLLVSDFSGTSPVKGGRVVVEDRETWELQNPPYKINGFWKSDDATMIADYRMNARRREVG